MGGHNEFLYDYLGNQYERKNLYLLEVAKLHKRIKDTNELYKVKLKKELKDLIKYKEKHPYNIRLKQYKINEGLFIKALEEKKKVFVSTLDKSLTPKIRRFKINLFESIEKAKFYKEYIDLSYDAQLLYKENKFKSEQILEIIKFIEKNQSELNKAIEDGKHIDKERDRNARLEFKSFKIEQGKIVEKEKRRLKTMRTEGTISKKANKNAILELDRRYKKALELKKFESPKKSNKELKKTKIYEIKNSTRQKLKVLNADIADTRSKTPSEVNKANPVIAYMTFLIPGLGQILKKQPEKGVLFLIGTLFTYLIAIPYAMGYGNYQGEGIKGLVSLAEGGARIDKSLIFMIEGVIAIILLLLAISIVLISFKDVLKVERNNIRGIRSRRWFETKNSLFQEGFPYAVSLPAFLIILFVIIVPIITTALLALTNMDPNRQSKFQWIFLDNYKTIALGEGIAGSVFWLILIWTIVWTLVATTLAIFIGFGLALLVNNDRIKNKVFFRTIYLLPWAVPSFITIMFFSILLSPNGALTEILVGIIGKRIEVKNDPTLTRISLILLQGWLGSAYVFLLSTGVLQSVPGDLYEAAEIDGATAWQKIRRITTPLVLFQIAPLLVTQYTFNFNNFSIIFLFNEGGPFNPTKFGNLAGSSDLLISYIYKLTMDNKYQAIGAAITIVVSLGLMVFAYLGFRNSKGFKEGRL